MDKNRTPLDLDTDFIDLYELIADIASIRSILDTCFASAADLRSVSNYTNSAVAALGNVEMKLNLLCSICDMHGYPRDMKIEERACLEPPR